MNILDWNKEFVLYMSAECFWLLTHWGQATHICVAKQTIIGSDNGLSAPSHNLNQCWNIVNCNIRNTIQWSLKRNSYIPFKKMHLEMSAAKWRPFCTGLIVLILPVTYIRWFKLPNVTDITSIELIIHMFGKNRLLYMFYEKLTMGDCWF